MQWGTDFSALVETFQTVWGGGGKGFPEPPSVASLRVSWLFRPHFGAFTKA